MRKQIIDFADSVVNPKDEDKRLTDKDFRKMINLGIYEDKEKIDKTSENFLKSKYFKLMMQPNDERKV